MRASSLFATSVTLISLVALSSASAQLTARPPLSANTGAANTASPTAAMPPAGTARMPKSTVGQYADEPSAKTKCGSDPVVWANLNSKVWHVAGDKYYGHTKHGAFMCQSVAAGQGIHAAKKS